MNAYSSFRRPAVSPGGDLIEEALDARSVGTGKASVIEQLRHVPQQLEAEA